MLQWEEILKILPHDYIHVVVQDSLDLGEFEVVSVTFTDDKQDCTIKAFRLQKSPLQNSLYFEPIVVIEYFKPEEIKSFRSPWWRKLYRKISK
jgi:hypothetical protein